MEVSLLGMAEFILKGTSRTKTAMLGLSAAQEKIGRRFVTLLVDHNGQMIQDSTTFELAANPDEVDELLTEALSKFGRDELLEKSVRTGATLAPVYSANELLERGITRRAPKH